MANWYDGMSEAALTDLLNAGLGGNNRAYARRILAGSQHAPTPNTLEAGMIDRGTHTTRRATRLEAGRSKTRVPR